MSIRSPPILVREEFTSTCSKIGTRGWLATENFAIQWPWLQVVAEAGELGLSFVAVAFSNVTVVSSNDILGQVISEVCYAQTTSTVGG